ncbi:DUF1080 domain-containing protein [Paraflavitalea sp. CAU 1676]|uniref:3-keto-disaccharide hydrolase n=1 Tax=Paraflavitalea sp. CAU 1676 TaxID=3032598 RepID=UPI0023DAA67E|nr:DUF1080 domain-containing protein [Paraflavitalea sp. CAU 1676]MDF2190829.1 DUF1080 domain-containing protein [Paraflavitalea sp. CAU 1676]
MRLFKSYLLVTCCLVSLGAGLLSFALQQTKDNTLSTEEKKAGWQLLFDGQSTNGWRPYRNQASEGWEVLNGQLHCKDGKLARRSDLITTGQFDNFELAFDWKIDKGFNSGVIYRVEEGNRATYETGPEYQLIDDEGYPDKLEDWQKSGSDYAMHPPTAIAAKPAGEYNQTRIVVKGAHVEHWLNGKKVVEFDLWTPEWEALKAKSKWKDAKLYGMIKKGHIALQDHGGGIWFKNIKIRPL